MTLLRYAHYCYQNRKPSKKEVFFDSIGRVLSRGLLFADLRASAQMPHLNILVQWCCGVSWLGQQAADVIEIKQKTAHNWTKSRPILLVASERLMRMNNIKLKKLSFDVDHAIHSCCALRTNLSIVMLFLTTTIDHLFTVW